MKDPGSKILVSACLLGLPTRYDGKSKRSQAVMEYLERENLLPIPVLDGGHLLYYLIELVKGSPVSEEAQVAGQYFGLIALAGLMSLAFVNDILRLVG